MRRAIGNRFEARAVDSRSYLTYMLNKFRKGTWVEGAKFAIVLLSEAEQFEFERFFEELPQRDQREVDQILELMAEHGPITNIEKSRPLGEGVYEFKTTNVRIFWFYDADRVVLISHGKKKNELTKNKQYGPEIARVVELMRRWNEWKAQRG